MTKLQAKSLRDKTTPETSHHRGDETQKVGLQTNDRGASDLKKVNQEKIGQQNAASANGKDPSSNPSPQDVLIDGKRAQANAKHPLDYDKNKSAKPS